MICELNLIELNDPLHGCHTCGLNSTPMITFIPSFFPHFLPVLLFHMSMSLQFWISRAITIHAQGTIRSY